ncbi:MAG: 5-aminolevulic acid synthase [Pseudomonadota bacterium]
MKPGSWVMLAAGLAMAAPAMAQDLPNLREARNLVFAEDGAIEWEIFTGGILSETDILTLDQINQIQPQAYYGAMAIAPDEGIAAQTTALTANYHNEDGARAAALAACEAVRDGEGAACVIVMVIRPEGWEPGRALQLSSEASAALRTEYRVLPRRSRAMATSLATGQWGLGESREAALAACDAADCEVVVEG